MKIDLIIFFGNFFGFGLPDSEDVFDLGWVVIIGLIFIGIQILDDEIEEEIRQKKQEEEDKRKADDNEQEEKPKEKPAAKK